MKKIILALLVLLSVGGFSASAQKFGHLDYLECLDTLQSYKTAKLKEKEIEESAYSMMTEIENEIRKLSAEYEQNKDVWSSVIRQSKERALYDLQGSGEQIQAEYQKNMEVIANRYYVKINEWFTEAVKIIGIRKGLDYILYYQEGAFWANPERGVNVTNEIITELLKLELANPIKEPGQ
jgi:Skp family chaperone for outer membrane proteins